MSGQGTEKDKQILAWDKMTVDEIREHAFFWNSNMAKRSTVEKHLRLKGCPEPSAQIDRLIRQKILWTPKPGYVAFTERWR